MDTTIRSLDDLRAFRNSLYRCLDPRADALFELADALLTAGAVPSPVHLSLAPAHRRGWGSLYAALSRGRIKEGPLRELLARYACAADASRAPVYAVDVSVWSRCRREARRVARRGRGVRCSGDAELRRRPEEGPGRGEGGADGGVVQRPRGRVREQAQAVETAGLRSGGFRSAAGEDAGRLKTARRVVREGTHRFTKKPTEPTGRG